MDSEMKVLFEEFDVKPTQQVTFANKENLIN